MASIDLTVAITGMNARADNPGPGVAVARCLRDAPQFTGRIIGLGYDALDPGLYLREYCDSAYLLPYPSAGDEAFMTSLRAIHDSEKIDIILPCLDAELPGMVRLTPQLDEMGIRYFLPRPNSCACATRIACPSWPGTPAFTARKSKPSPTAAFSTSARKRAGVTRWW